MRASSNDPRRTKPSIDHGIERNQNPGSATGAWPGLATAAARAGVPLTKGQLARFGQYRQLLLEWNARFNLTAIKDPIEIERRLFLDALLLVPVITRLTEARPARLVDIGSGAGFPGIPLAIARPELTVTLVEATGKKVTFLDQVIAALELPRVSAIHARAEDVARQREHRAAYDVATARAVASLPALIELTMPLLRQGGHAVFPKGREIEVELAASREAAVLLGAAIVGDDIVGGTRLVVVEKRQPTPDRYPRRAGIPAREPLGTASADRQVQRADARCLPYSPKSGGKRPAAASAGRRRQPDSDLPRRVGHSTNGARRRDAG